MKRIYEDKYLIFDKPKINNYRLYIKKLLNYIDNVYYKMVLRLVKPNIKKNNKKYFTSICAIFKDEADYLKEWIEFHRVVGVEHFYLYNNKSSDEYYSVLEPYINKGIVDLKEWPNPQSQMEAYKDFMIEKAKETQWVGFIDLDEYVVPNKTDTIGDFLAKFKNRPSVIMYWKCFGSSGLLNRNVSRLITEDFTVAWPKCVDIGKFFFNTDYEYFPEYKKNGFMHYMWAKNKGIVIPPVNVFDKVCTYDCNPVKSNKMPIQINHYLLKSLNEYKEKKSKRGGGVHPIGMHDMNYFFEHEMKCCETDYHAYKYLIKLKMALEGSNK